jgi:LmbE family N-acetylglucosaminyl deacetylase
VKKEDISVLAFLSQKVKSFFGTQMLVDKPEGNHILVIAPHPDDDILGCGGTIRLHRNAGHTVSILYLTEGEQGIKNLNAKKTAIRRKNEAIRAAAHLDVSEEYLYHLHLHDGHLINESGSNHEFRELLEAVHPDIIYLPSFIERHSDHYAANVLLKNNLIQSVTIAAYEVWTPLVPNRLVNISPVIQAKKNAMLRHKSQLKELDYLDAALGLNRYRAAMCQKDTLYAEAFIYCSSEEYFEMMIAVEHMN